MFWGGTPQILVTATESQEIKGEFQPVLDDEGNPMLDPVGNPYMVQVTEAKVVNVKREVDLAKDVRDIGGKVGDYVDIMKSFKAYPVINLRISRVLW